MAPLERLKILMQIQGNEKVYTGVWQVGASGEERCSPAGGCLAATRSSAGSGSEPAAYWNRTSVMLVQLAAVHQRLPTCAASVAVLCGAAAARPCI